MLDEITSWYVCYFSVGSPSSDIRRRNQAYNVARREARHVSSYRFDYTCRLVAKTAREVSLLQVSVSTEHYFCSIEANALYPDLHLTAGRGWNLDIFDLQNARIAIVMNTHDARHNSSTWFRLGLLLQSIATVAPAAPIKLRREVIDGATSVLLSMSFFMS